MNEALRTVITRILTPTELLKLRTEECLSPYPEQPVVKPKPEPEIIASRQYHRAVTERNYLAAEIQREQLLELEVQILLTLAHSYLLVCKSATTKPMITY